MKYSIGWLFILVTLAAACIFVWGEYHPRHGVYSHEEIEEILNCKPFIRRSGDESLVELKKIGMRTKYACVRIKDRTTGCYSQIPIERAMNLLSIVDKFNHPPPTNDPGVYSIVPDFAEIEVQYLVKEDGALRMPIEIGIREDNSLEIGVFQVFTTDSDAKKAVSEFLQFAENVLNANPLKEDREKEVRKEREERAQKEIQRQREFQNDGDVDDVFVREVDGDLEIEWNLTE